MTDPAISDPTRLSYWFPLIEAAGVPVPRTIILPELSQPDVEGLIGQVGDAVPWLGFESLVQAIGAAAEPFWFPFFLRTDFTSGKHEWANTCFVTTRERLGWHVHYLAEYSLCADMPGLPIDRWVVREFMETTPAFHAFRGMPISREFRLFIRDGCIEHVQPYWPPEAIEQGNPDSTQWQAQLAALNTLSDDDRIGIEWLAKKVSRAVPGFWSVDCLLTFPRGWVVTDMAEGDKSFRWDGGV